MFRMNEFLSISSEEVDFFDIENIDHEHRAKITLPARDANEIKNMKSYCDQAWDEERQIYLGYSLPIDDLPRKARITDIVDSTTFDKETKEPNPMMTLTVILPKQISMQLVALLYKKS